MPLCPYALISVLEGEPYILFGVDRHEILRRAHQENDRAVMDAYGFVKGSSARTSESACVAELMKMYQALAEGK